MLCYQLGLSVRSDEVSVNPFTDCLRDVQQQSRAVLPAMAFSAFRRGECKYLLTPSLTVCEMYTSSHVLCYQLWLSVRSDEVSVNPFTDCLRDVHQQSRAVLPAGAFSAFRRGEC